MWYNKICTAGAANTVWQGSKLSEEDIMQTEKKHLNTFHWLRSLLWMVGILLAVSSALCAYMLFSLRATMMQTSDDLTQYLQQRTDDALESAVQYTAILQISSENRLLSRQSNPEPNALIYRFCDQMASYTTVSSLVDGVFIYYPQSGYIAGENGFYPAKNYYQLGHMLSDAGYKEWLGQIGSAQGGLNCIEEDGKQELYWLAVTEESGVPFSVIAVKLDLDKLVRIAESNGVQDSAVGILYEGKLLISSGDREKLEALLPNLPQAARTETFDTLIYQKQSDFSSLSYLDVYFHKGNLQPLWTAMALCLSGVAACAAFGIAASVHISRKNERPLRALLLKVGTSPESAEDAYATIGAHIDTLALEKSKSENRRQEQQSIIESLFLNMVLRGEMHSEYAIFSAAKRYDVVFENPYYLMCVICAGKEQQAPEAMLSRMRFCCEKAGYVVLLSYLNSQYRILFNLENAESPTVLVPFVGELMEYVFAPAVPTASLGECYDSLVEISRSYAQAVRALRRAQSNGGRQILCYNPAQDGMLRSSTDSSWEALCTALSRDDIPAAQAAVPELFSQYLSPALDSGVLRIRTAAVQNLILETAQRWRADGRELPPEISEESLMQAEDAAALRAAVERLLCGAHPAQQQLDVMKNHSVAERAYAYIHQNFADPMLGLYMISDELGVSNSYLSGIFKTTYGMGIVQYINRLRIDQAKDLLAMTDMSIKKIAQTVGFSSDVSFSRVFKKYESVPPSAMRK